MERLVGKECHLAPAYSPGPSCSAAVQMPVSPAPYATAGAAGLPLYSTYASDTGTAVNRIQMINRETAVCLSMRSRWIGSEFFFIT